MVQVDHRITQHAKFRYAQRVLGYDVEEHHVPLVVEQLALAKILVRFPRSTKIRAPPDVRVDKTGKTSFFYDGHTCYIVENEQVLTVFVPKLSVKRVYEHLRRKVRKRERKNQKREKRKQKDKAPPALSLQA